MSKKTQEKVLLTNRDYKDNVIIEDDDIKITKKEIIKNIIKIICLYFIMMILLHSSKFIYALYVDLDQKVPQDKENNIKVAICTMAKLENLYIEEFVEYYVKLGIDHIFIYDDNDPNTERIIDAIDNKYKSKVTTYENIKGKIKRQSDAYTNCYHTNMKEYDWFLMIDVDEFLFIVNNTLKNYLSNEIYNKCDFIKFNWATANDNNLVYYDSRPLFERFKPPYIKESFVKSIIRSNIPELHYWVHSPDYSPKRNVTCNSNGDLMDISNRINIEINRNQTFSKAFLIHFRYKTTEEFIKKYKRGYSTWFGNYLDTFLSNNVRVFFEINRLSLEKINLVERELNISLTKYKIKYFLRALFFMN